MKPLTPIHEAFELDTTSRARLLVAPMAGGRTTSALKAACLVARSYRLPVYVIHDSYNQFRETTWRSYLDLEDSNAPEGLSMIKKTDLWAYHGVFIAEDDVDRVCNRPASLSGTQFFIGTTTTDAEIPLWRQKFESMVAYSAPRIGAGGAEHHLPPCYYKDILATNPRRYRHQIE